MADQNGSANLKESVDQVQASVESKGKGKATAEPETHDVSMDGEDSSSEEELDEVSHTMDTFVHQADKSYRQHRLVSFKRSTDCVWLVLTWNYSG